MTRYVIDASVMMKWLVPEEHFANALWFRAPEHELIAPDHFRAEVANAIWKKLRRTEIEPDGAADLIRALDLVPVVGVETSSLIASAFEVAAQYGRTVYDSLYVALALRDGCDFVTADKRLVNALQGSLSAVVKWIGEFPAS